MNTMATAPPTMAPTSDRDCCASPSSRVSGVLVVSCVSSLVDTSLLVSVVACTGREGGTKSPGHSSSSKEASKTTQVLLMTSRAWWTGSVATSDDVIHRSMYLMISLAVAWALSCTFALSVTWFGDPGKQWNSPSVMSVCANSQLEQCWETPWTIATKVSWTLSSGSLI